MGAVCVEGFILLGQREEILQSAARHEALARAQIMHAAIESEYLNGRTPTQQFLDRLRQSSDGDTLVLLDESGAVSSFSGDQSIATSLGRDPEASKAISQVRSEQIARQDSLLSILPISLNSTGRGAIAVIHPLRSLQSEVTYARRSLIVATMLVTLATFVIVLFVTDRYLTRPLENIVAGTEAFGSGDLDYRVASPHGRGALFRLTMAFNRMADKLATQRQIADQKAEEQLSLERQLRQT